jgi:hypothetical protein
MLLTEQKLRRMLTNRKDREDYMMLLTEREAETDAHRYERQRRLHDTFNRTGGWDWCWQLGKTENSTWCFGQNRRLRHTLTDMKDREDYMMLLTEQEAETDAHRYKGKGRLYDAFNRTGGWYGCSQIGRTRKTICCF